jgi:antitoxin VapB
VSNSLFDMSVASFRPIPLSEANDALCKWQHKMGALHRGNQGAVCHGLFHGEKLVAVTTVSTLIAPRVGGGLIELTRQNCCELSRLCAERSGLCRVAIRLWREFVFPALGYQFAISYQDADLHSGNTYRFDGWRRAAYARSGKDTRSQRPGRNKWVWIWCAPGEE